MRQLCRMGVHARPRVIVRSGGYRLSSCPSCQTELIEVSGKWKPVERRLTLAAPSLTDLVLAPRADTLAGPAA